MDVHDAFIVAASPSDHRFTWDTHLNRNSTIPKGPRCRFDRVFFNQGAYQKVDFSLEGKELIADIGLHPSDHFAVFCRFHKPVVKEE